MTTRSVFVTGASRGIGRAVALAFATPGTLVAVAARDQQRLDSVAREAERLGATALPILLDVKDPQSVNAAFDTYRANASTLDVLVNNAGIGGGQPIENSDIDAWRDILDTNVAGTYLVSRAAVPLMREGGRIINMSSVLGRFGVPAYTAYCASKHAVIGFTRALALELAPRQITVNALCPGWVDTEMAERGMQGIALARQVPYEEARDSVLRATPLGRIIQPEEVAALVRFLASPEASAITGQTYNICGGQTMA